MKNAMRLSVLIVLFLVCFISSVFAIGNTGNNQEKVVVRAESTDNKIINQKSYMIADLNKIPTGINIIRDKTNLNSIPSKPQSANSVSVAKGNDANIGVVDEKKVNPTPQMPAKPQSANSVSVAKGNDANIGVVDEKKVNPTPQMPAKPASTQAKIITFVKNWFKSSK